MDAKDLMIGDWVLHDSKPKTVDVIWGKKVSLNDPTQVWGSIYTDKFNDDDIEPILLTSKILEENGFDVSDKEVMQYHFEEDGEKYHFSLRQMYNKDGKPHGYSFYAFNVLTLLDYVHQLQHALRLCGINKEIEI